MRVAALGDAAACFGWLAALYDSLHWQQWLAACPDSTHPPLGQWPGGLTHTRAAPSYLPRACPTPDPLSAPPG